MKKIYLIAVIASVLAGVSLFNFLITVKKESKVNFEEIIVANTDIEAHTVITPEMLTTKQIPAEGIHQYAAKQQSEVVGLVSTEKILKDEEILVPKLKKIGENNNGLSYAITENMRAVTVAVDEISGVAGFITPGDKVDILGVVMAGSQESQVQTSTIILQNIKVLAVGKNLSTAEGETLAYTSVTLLTTPEQAVKLNLVTATGSMRMILRGPTDNEIKYTPPITSNNISN